MAKRVLRKRSNPVERSERTTWEYDGVTYNKREAIYIEGEDGLFQFWSVDESKSRRETICVWWVGHHFRHFYAERVINPNEINKKREPVCGEHPSYGAVRRPRTECGVCWAAYEAKQRKADGEV